MTSAAVAATTPAGVSTAATRVSTTTAGGASAAAGSAHMRAATIARTRTAVARSAAAAAVRATSRARISAAIGWPAAHDRLMHIELRTPSANTRPATVTASPIAARAITTRLAPAHTARLIPIRAA
jgi:hypothetical protein